MPVNTIKHEDLLNFTGTSTYYRISKRFLLTDGTKYLCEHAGCFWLMDAASSHLLEIGVGDWFVLIRLTVKQERATLYFEDGNGHEHARQEIEYTDFPLSEITLYACWDGEHWVLMLPSEY